MNFEHYARHTICDNEHFRCTMDELRRPSDVGFDQFLLIHLHFYEFSKSALARLLSEWMAFRSVTDAPLFACCDDDEQQPDKWARFVSLLGFQPLPETVLPDQSGRSRRVFVSLKDIAGGRQADDEYKPTAAAD